jgi:hypothetical protein
MIDYSKWDEKNASVGSLLLDPQNPRIPSADSGTLDQRGLIAELIKHDDVLGLAQDIATDGWSRVESLIAFVDDDGKMYVLEGNRRLAALKVLLTPEIAPPDSQKRVRKLSKDADHESIRKVRVLIAPSRADAAPLIMKRHTRQQIAGWVPLMQARFYRRFADAGMTAADMAKQYGSTPGEVAEFLRLDTVYGLARRLDNLAPDVKAIVDDPREFNASALQRIIDVPRARERLGIEFDSEGEITGKVDKSAFKPAFERILSDIARKKEDTRSLNKAADVERYLSDIEGDLPDVSKKGSFNAKNFADPRTPTPSAQKPAAKRASGPTTRQSASVIPRGVKCELKSTRINDIFDELRRLRLDKNPNASAVLFRILLELCIGHYLDKTKQIDPLLEAARKKGKPNDWYPALRQLLDALLKDPSITLVPLARKRLNKFVSDEKSSLSVDGLDSYVHNRFSPPNAKDLRSYWETFEDLFIVLLKEPPPPQRAS